MHDFEHLDYYELLGVPRNATQEEIKRAYRQQVALYHPDRNIDKTPAAQQYSSLRTQRLNEAYRVLSDFSARSAYNRGQALPSVARSGEPSPSMGASPGGTATATRRPPVPRDHKAELYEQARAHLAAGRQMQAVATLRELQQISPFYRDSATLLAQAEAETQSNTDQPAEQPAASSAATQENDPAHRSNRWLWIGGTGAVVLVVLAALFGIPQLQGAGGVSALAPTSTATVESVGVAIERTDTPVSVPPTATPEPSPTTEPPTATPVPPTATLEPSPTTVPPTATPVPPTATLEPSPTTVPPTATPVPPTATPVPPTATPVPPTATPEVIAETGSILLGDDFATASGWANLQGNGWSVGYVDGVYQITTIAGIGNIWSYRTAYAAGPNFSLGSDVRVLNGQAGIIMRYVNEQNYLAFKVNPTNSSYVLEQWVAGVPSIIATGQSNAIQASPDVYNRLVARLAGNQVQLFINNQPVANETVFGVTPTNVIGVVAIAENVPVATAFFDNIEIRTLE
jgi:cytoskeletal protein RodZ